MSMSSTEDETRGTATRRSVSQAPPIRDSFNLPGGERPSDDTIGESERVGDDATGGWTDVDNRAWTDRHGVTYYYREKPLLQVCPFVLTQECCERLAYYGIMPTLKPFLKHSLGVGDAQASSLVEYYAALIYIPSFLSAIVADTFTGTFLTICIFSCFYAAGLALLVVAANETMGAPWMVYLSLYFLIVTGGGGIKSCVNVFGAQQMHPILQSGMVEKFFTYFYASINVGSIVGGLAVPQVAASVSYFVAYMIPLFAFLLASAVFVMGSTRYVKMKPQGSPVVSVAIVLIQSARHCGFEKAKRKNGGPCDDVLVDDTVGLIKLFPVVAMVMPLLIAYNQMTTAFLTQGEKMDSSIFGLKFTPALMQNIDPIGVILSTLLLDQLLFPFLRSKDLMPTVMMKFFIGNLLGVVALLCAFVVELQVIAQDKPNTMSIWWQIPQFALIACAEIFTISTSYEVAFTLAPDALKTVSSACNLIFFSIAGFISGFLFVICEGWMPDFKPDEPASYKDAHYDYYYLVLATVCIVGAIMCLCLLPYFSWITRTQRKSAEDEDNDDDAGQPLSPHLETAGTQMSETRVSNASVASVERPLVSPDVTNSKRQSVVEPAAV